MLNDVYENTDGHHNFNSASNLHKLVPITLLMFNLKRNEQFYLDNGAC